MSTKNSKTGHIRKIFMAMEKKQKKNRNLFLTIFLLQLKKVSI